MNRSKTFILIMIALLSCGCFHQNIVSVSKQKTNVAPEDIVSIAQQSGSSIEDPDTVVIHLAVQILESTYNEYKETGMTEDDFQRMPTNDFTINLWKLYRDMSSVSC